MIENLTNSFRLYHVSENPSIKRFEPRPSPSHYESITSEVVFAITDKLLHNYLVPRDCPRVTFYSKHDTSQHDKEVFLSKNSSSYVVAVENKWREVIQQTTLYCYEFPTDNFALLDKGAGYYISYKTVTPISIRPVYDILNELLKRGVELRFLPTLLPLAQEISKSTLQFSLIGCVMRHQQQTKVT
ncbi:hypothetical protein DU508_11960 [Pedobacter chinensis]|uniref:Uncharacterized protein n=1 Tax=Pedobacter chinensis TaxID=2282421 RepID=A0A369PUQ9_9SPHI|nr:DUF6886 family protein [Pedobacter chinensis]RDC56313.1 hypothetical protein DU508_11960 [Pedobacter chinensis]